MSSFFYTKNKYIISFNQEDLVKNSISPILTECISSLKEDDRIHISIIEAKDIKIENLIFLIDFTIQAKKIIKNIHFSLSEELKVLLKEVNLNKLFN